MASLCSGIVWGYSFRRPPNLGPYIQEITGMKNVQAKPF